MSALVGGIGSGLGALSSFIFGRKDKMKQISTLTPEQKQYLSSVLGQLSPGGTFGQGAAQGQDYYSRILAGDKDAYNRFAAPYMQQFQQEIIPGLSERFAGMAGPFGNPAQSSGFGQAVGSAGAQLQANLANLYENIRSQAAQQSLGNYMQMANLGLGTRAFQPAYQPGSTGIAGGLFSGIASGTGLGFGQQYGQSLGKRINDYFGRQNQSIQDQDPYGMATGPEGGGMSYNPYSGGWGW